MRALAPALAALLALLGAAGCKLDPPGRCEARAECPAGRDCIDGICTNCRADGDCRHWEACEVGLCEPLAGRCNADGDCSSWQVCDAVHVCTLRTGAGFCAVTADCTAVDPLTECDGAHRCSFAIGKCNEVADCPAWMGGCTANACSFSAGATDDVLAVGTLAEGRSDRGAAARVAAPSKVETGLDVGAGSDGRGYVDPVSGSVVYRHVGDPGGDTLRFLRRDAIGASTPTGPSLYPAEPSANDPVALDATACPATWDHWVMHGVNGAILYGCPVAGGALRDYFDAAGTKRRLAVVAVHAWGASGGLLLTSASGALGVVAATALPSVAATDVTGLPAGQLLAARTRSPVAGFLVAWREAGADRLYQVDEATGAATLSGSYPAVPGAWGDPAWEILGSDGALYARAFNVTEAILKRVPGGSLTTPYDEGSTPAGSNDFTVAPFKAWLRLDPGSFLLTRP